MYIVVKNIFILFALIFLGVFLGKKEIIRPSCTPDLSNFLVKVTLPATVFCSMIRPFEKELLFDSAMMFGFMLAVHLSCLVLGIAAVKACKIPKAHAGVWLFACMFSNNGFMGFPLAESIYGSNGLFLMAIANVVSNFLIFSLGVKLLTQGQSIGKLSGRQLFYNNINIAVLAGLLFYFMQWQVPETFMTVLQYLAGLTAPLSMILVGLSISKSKIREMCQDKKLFILAGIRLFLIPLLMLFIVKLLPFQAGSLLPGLFVLTCALPAPSSVSIITEQYQTDTKTAAQTVFITTLSSLISIPVMMFLNSL